MKVDRGKYTIQNELEDKCMLDYKNNVFFEDIWNPENKGILVSF